MQRYIRMKSNRKGQQGISKYAYEGVEYYAAYNGKVTAGIMINNGAVTKNINAGESYIIPKGYHDGTGKVTGNSLAS